MFLIKPRAPLLFITAVVAQGSAFPISEVKLGEIKSLELNGKDLRPECEGVWQKLDWVATHYTNHGHASFIQDKPEDIMSSLQTPNCPFDVAINHSEVRFRTGNVHCDEDKWSLSNIMSTTYSIETAAVQYYLHWRTSHIVQFCWVFQQAACWTKKNQMKCK